MSFTLVKRVTLYLLQKQKQIYLIIPYSFVIDLFFFFK